MHLLNSGSVQFQRFLDAPKANNTWSVTEAQLQLEYLLEIRSDYFIPFLFRDGLNKNWLSRVPF
jgi:hypothetical protein